MPPPYVHVLQQKRPTKLESTFNLESSEVQLCKFADRLAPTERRVKLTQPRGLRRKFEGVGHPSGVAGTEAGVQCFHEGSVELQIPPLRFASVGMTKRRG